jgi:hypothetical protein
MTLWHASTELLLTAAGLAAVAAESLRLAVAAEAMRAAGLGLGLGLGYADTGG